ncbi:MAG: ATP-grasp domain-containing protein [Prevotella sp.]|nr:ATP-grasp domain-containing protein [Prevotella sp.]
MQKLLVLGGKPIGSVEIVRRAKDLGHYVIVADYLPKELSQAKLFADESWDVSTADIDKLERLCITNHVDGITTGVHEFNINRMLDLCERLHLPCYCKRSTWLYCDSKVSFKSLCMANDVPVAKKYDLNDLSDDSLQGVDFPVITKPVDGSGSRGFSVCHDAEQLRNGYNHAKEFSPTGSVLVEDYIPYDAVIVHYTMVNGKCLFSGISDKYSVKFPSTGASVMGLQLFPSRGIQKYLELLDAKVRNMFESAGFTDGPIWIEAFYDGTDKFIFNEMGYRFGGSMTNYPVQYFYGIDQLDQLIHVALGESFPVMPKDIKPGKKYCILPVHIHAGRIDKVIGIDDVLQRDDVYAFVPVHFAGDDIQEWGSAQQVFCYLHILYDDLQALQYSIHEVLEQLKVEDVAGNNLLFTLFEVDELNDEKYGN